MKIRKTIDVCMQWDKEVENAIHFNKIHNNEYVIVCNDTLIDAKNLLLFLRKGYTIDAFESKIVLYPKDYDLKDEVVKGE